LELFITHTPKFSKIFILLVFGSFVLLLALNLECAGAFHGLLHFEFAAHLLFEEAVSFIFCFSHLFVENLLFVVAQGAELANLNVDHCLTSVEHVLHFSFLTVLLHLVELLFLTCESLNTLLLHEFLLKYELLHAQLFSVGLSDVLSHLEHFPFALQFSDLFTLNVLFDLAFDEFTFQHLFLQRLNIVQLEIFKLVRDSLCIVLPLAPFLLKFLTHLCIILFEFLLF